MPLRSRHATLWALSCYFNPCGYRRRLANYREFRKRLAAPLITVELSFDGRFELGADDAGIVVRLRGGAVLWQEERLLDIGWAHLPALCRRRALRDRDVHFESDGWLEGAEALLEGPPVAQPLSRVIELPPELRTANGLRANRSGHGESLLSRIQRRDRAEELPGPA